MINSNSGVYLISNKAKRTFYIGSAVNLSKRANLHFYGLCNGSHFNKRLQYAWNKYGERAFSFRVLLICDKESLIFFEQRVLDFFKVKYGWGRLYNSSPTAGSTLGVKFTEETKAKIGFTSKGRNIGRKHTEEELKKMSVSNKGSNLGRKHSDEAKLKMSKFRKGRKFSEEHKMNIRIANLGHVVSSETREKLRIKNTGKKLSEETKKKISMNSKGSKPGRKLSLETRRRMSIAHTGLRRTYVTIS